MSDDVIITKAVHKLKIKTGPGGFDRDKVVQAKSRLESSADMFPEVAADDLELIEQALQLLKQENPPRHVLEKIMAAGVELKAHSAMFQFPLVTEVADSLLKFCMGVKTLSPIMREVISHHLNALKIAIGQGPRAITPQDHQDLLQDLEKVSQKVLREQA